VFTQPPLLIDLLTSVWVVFIFVTLFGLLPSIAFPQVSLPSLSSRIVGGFVRTVGTIAIGSILWTKLGLFTWLTAAIVYSTGLIIGWMASYQWQFKAKFEQVVQRVAISTVDIFDRGLSLEQFIQWLLLPWKFGSRLFRTRFDLQQWSPPLVLLAAVSTISIVGFTILLRFEHPLNEFRFSHPDTYSQLLTTQKILAREIPDVGYLPIFASLAAFFSALTGTHPMQAINFLGAILGTILVLSVGYTVRCLTKNGSAALVSTYSLGAYLFTFNLPISNRLPLTIQLWLVNLQDNLNSGLIRSWAVSDFELGAIFTILALGCSTHIARPQQRVEATINTFCCLLLVITISPSFLIPILFAGFGMIFGRQMALFTLTAAWVLFGCLVAVPESNFPFLKGMFATLPIGLSLLVSLLFVAISAIGRLFLASWSAPICLMIFMAITLNFSLPSSPQISYLEYDAAARKSVEISRLFSHHQWTVVAPIEQLSQIYGRGWYQDLAEFTTKYKDRVAVPTFNFPSETQLLVFAEKMPFNADKLESPVGYSVLQDPTYRYYRSPSGRTKLSRDTIQLCETYRRHHPDTRIYYEDDRLLIYQFSAHLSDGS
jgi:hypothetical protein